MVRQGVFEHVENDVKRDDCARSNNALPPFTKVDPPPATQPQTAVWHFGWHITNERQTMAGSR